MVILRIFKFYFFYFFVLLSSYRRLVYHCLITSFYLYEVIKTDKVDFINQIYQIMVINILRAGV